MKEMERKGKERLVATRERSEAPRNVNTYKFALHVVTTFDTWTLPQYGSRRLFGLSLRWQVL